MHLITKSVQNKSGNISQEGVKQLPQKNTIVVTFIKVLLSPI